MRKHSYSKRRTWRKLHLAADEKTGQILAQVLTDNKTDDALVQPTWKSIEKVGKSKLGTTDEVSAKMCFSVGKLS